MQQTFSMELEPQVSLMRVSGDVEVKGWDRREISLDWDEHEGDFQREGNTLILMNGTGDIKLHVPYDTEMRVEDLRGEIVAQSIRRIALQNVRGDVELENIGADTGLENTDEVVSLTDIGGDLHVQKVFSLHAYRKIGGKTDVQDVSIIEIESVAADLKISRAETVAVGNVGGDLQVSELSGVLRCGHVSGDCEVSGSPQAEVNLGNVGGSLEIAGALLVHLGNTGGDTAVRDVQRHVTVGNVGGNASLAGMGGDLKVGRIAGDATLSGLGGSFYVGGIGGDLAVQAVFGPEVRAQIHIGGDASLTLPEDASLTLQAAVGGSINGASLSSGSGGKLVRLVYGEGAAYLHMSVGGDLTLSGAGNPQVSSAGMPWWELGQEMARVGQELGEEFRKTFRDLGWSGVIWTDEMSRRVEEQVRRTREKVEHSARKAEERAQRAEERARQHAERGRVRMKVNEREWQMSPARLDDLVSRAQQAAMEGVAGAMEAVERAVNNLRVPHPPSPPRPGSRPAPPVPPVPPAPPTPPAGSARPRADQFPQSVVPPPFEQTTQTTNESASHLEQEREAILRMIAQGRITAEEGDMLLEGLGS
jgi:DUF4097 and DUF4098 domain-containing protein YvlB